MKPTDWIAAITAAVFITTVSSGVILFLDERRCQETAAKEKASAANLAAALDHRSTKLANDSWKAGKGVGYVMGQCDLALVEAEAGHVKLDKKTQAICDRYQNVGDESPFLEEGKKKS